jgi:DNA uptake protein ComE-like DNA-binding protein
MKLAWILRARTFTWAITALVLVVAQRATFAAETKTAPKIPTSTKTVSTIDLNKASESQLESIPGIGLSYAKKIIAARPYRSVDELSKAGLPATTIDRLRSRVSVADEKPLKAEKPARADATAALPDLNKATESQLEEVPGIGAAYAKKIIAGRPYKSVDDLSKAGLSAAAVKRIKPLVTVGEMATAHTVAKPIQSSGAPERLDLNKATESELEQVPGIGASYAKKIIADRPYKSIDDLSKAGIPAATIARIKSFVTVGGEAAAPVKGMVWVNLDSKVYHKEGSRWYGHTKNGRYMSEADAIKGGFHSSKQKQ